MQNLENICFQLKIILKDREKAREKNIETQLERGRDSEKGAGDRGKEVVKRGQEIERKREREKEKEKNRKRKIEKNTQIERKRQRKGIERKRKQQGIERKRQ